MTRTAVTTDQIREHLAMKGTRSVAEIATHFECSETQIHNKCDEMVEDGLLERSKRPVKVTKSNGETYMRDAVKVYRVRVQPPVAKPQNDIEAHQIRVQGTPGAKSDAEGTLITAPTSGELRTLISAEAFIRPDVYGSVTFPKPVQKDTSINTAIAAIATLRRTLTPDQLSALGVTLADPLADALEEISGEGGFDNFNHQAYRLRSALADKGLEIVERSDD